LDNWAAANMPVQIYLAAACSRLLGYSLSLLRCTTIALLGVALLSFYALLRELGHKTPTATVAVLSMLASPLVLMLGFTFMSDVQFLGWMLLTLWLYVRAFRAQSATSVLCASVAAACAIGTRQFGIAILAGFLLASLVKRREIQRPIRFLVSGSVIPLLAAGAQFYAGLKAPSFTQAFRLAEQHAFLSNTAPVLLRELFWRCCVVLQYTGMPLLPAMPLLLWRRRSSGEAMRVDFRLIITATAVLAIMLALFMRSAITARPEAQHRGMWEPLELYWLLPTQLARLRPAMRLLDLAGIVGAAVLVWTATGVLLRARAARQVSVASVFLATTAATLLALHLTYVQLNDTYIVAFIPFALLFAFEPVRNASPSGIRLRLSTGLPLSMILLTALWMRSEYAAQQAAWQASDELMKQGVSPADIQAPLHWAEYHGAFDAWVASGAPGFKTITTPASVGYDQLHDPFYEWSRTRGDEAEYRVTDSSDSQAPEGFQLISLRGYRNARFTRRFVVTSRRDSNRH
jgi:hypothetical protein